MEITGDKLSFIANKYDMAIAANAPRVEAFITNFKQYNGSKEIDGSHIPAKVVRNITREIVESQINSQIPRAKVTTQCIDERHVNNARTIESMCDYYLKKLKFSKKNDVDERNTYSFGSSVWLADYDTSDLCGKMDIRVTHPKFFTPQPGVGNIEDMDYCFLDLPMPREEIERRYNVSLEEYEGDIPQGDEGYDAGEDSAGEMVLLHICFYRNEKGDVCEYIWTDDKEILDVGDYYARTLRYCETCGRRAELCEDSPCENPKYIEVEETEEELSEDIYDANGNLLIPKMTQEYKNGVPQFEERSIPATDEAGQPVMLDIGGTQVPSYNKIKVPKMIPTVLPYYKPKCFPVVIRVNTSAVDGDWCGISDCEVIRDLQQTVNKLESRAFEKSIKSGTIVAVPYDSTIEEVDNSVHDRTVRLKPNQSAKQFGVINTEVNVAQDINQSDRHYESAKKISGITNSFTGQADTTAKSGKAKQIQIQQSAGRLESKRVMKCSFYASLYRIIFELNLAYRDETITLCNEDEYGTRCNIHFNRYSFYKFNPKTGRWIIDDDYLFEAIYAEMPEDQRELMWELNMANFEKGMFGDPALSETKLRYWIKQERARYPHAYEEVNYWRRQVQAEKEAMMRASAQGGVK